MASTFNMEKLSLRHTVGCPSQYLFFRLCGLTFFPGLKQEEMIVTDGEGKATVVLGCEDLNATKLLTKLVDPRGKDVEGCWAIANPSFGLADGIAEPHFAIHVRLPSADETYDLKIFSNTTGGDSFSSAVHYKVRGDTACAAKFPLILTTASPVALLEPQHDTLNVGDTVTFRVGLSPGMEAVSWIHISCQK